MSASPDTHGVAQKMSRTGSPVGVPIYVDFGMDEKPKKDPYLAKYTKGLNYVRIVKYLAFVLAMVGIVILALQVSKGKSLYRHRRLDIVEVDANPSFDRPGHDPEAQPRDGHCASYLRRGG